MLSAGTLKGNTTTISIGCSSSGVLRRYCVVVCMVVCLYSCTADNKQSAIPGTAQTALDSVINHIDDGRYDRLYEEASDEWRSQSTPEESNATFQRVTDKLGKARMRISEIEREDEPSGAGERSVTVIYQTSFDRGEGVERFTLIEHGGRWALAKYYVSSTLLK